jgi:hypothetical protein
METDKVLDRLLKDQEFREMFVSKMGMAKFGHKIGI